MARTTIAITVALPPVLCRALDRVAQQQDRSRSYCLREALVQWLEQHHSQVVAAQREEAFLQALDGED